MFQHLVVRLAYVLHVLASEMKGGLVQRNIYVYSPIFLLMKFGLMANNTMQSLAVPKERDRFKDDRHGFANITRILPVEILTLSEIYNDYLRMCVF